MRRILSFAMACLLMVSIPVTALAGEYDISVGSVTVSATESGQTVTQQNNANAQGVSDSNPVICGSSSTNVIKVDVDAGSTANVTLESVTVDSSNRPAMEVTGGGDAVIELNGNNSLTNDEYSYNAALQISDGSSITIQDAVPDENGKTGTLTAQGGSQSAGIGSNWMGNAGDITINSGTVKAQGGYGGAGIGSGYATSVGNIVINDGDVTAAGGDGGAGVGTGMSGTSGDIAITGGKVDATGGDDYGFAGGAGIGSGNYGNQNNPTSIEISGDAQVTAAGGPGAEAIGRGGNTIDGHNSGETTVDTSKLTPEGSVNGVAGTYVAPAASSTVYRVDKPLFTVEAEDGGKLDYTESEADGVLTVAAEEQEVAATFRITRSSLKKLQSKGIDKLLVKLAGVETELVISELLAMDGDKFVLTVANGAAELKVDGKVVEI